MVQVTATRLADAWTAEIADDGEGIAPENIDKIFNPFFTTRAKGAGLGLAYASQAIKAHGGVISAENRTEGGALFRVEIPLSQSGMLPAAVSGRGNGRNGDSKRPKALQKMIPYFKEGRYGAHTDSRR